MPKARAATTELKETVNNLFINSGCKSTRAAYNSVFKTFIQFLLLHGLTFDCSILPQTTEDNTTHFYTGLAGGSIGYFAWREKQLQGCSAELMNIYYLITGSPREVHGMAKGFH